MPPPPPVPNAAARLAEPGPIPDAAAAAGRAQRLLRARGPVEQPVVGDARAVKESAKEVVRSVINSSGFVAIAIPSSLPQYLLVSIRWFLNSRSIAA